MPDFETDSVAKSEVLLPNHTRQFLTGREISITVTLAGLFEPGSSVFGEIAC